jgi:hypothetical protein
MGDSVGRRSGANMVHTPDGSALWIACSGMNRIGEVQIKGAKIPQKNWVLDARALGDTGKTDAALKAAALRRAGGGIGCRKGDFV